MFFEAFLNFWFGCVFDAFLERTPFYRFIFTPQIYCYLTAQHHKYIHPFYAVDREFMCDFRGEDSA